MMYDMNYLTTSCQDPDDVISSSYSNGSMSVRLKTHSIVSFDTICGEVEATSGFSVPSHYELNTSSVTSCFEPMVKTFLQKKSIQKVLPEDLEVDIVVNMPPKREKLVRMRVNCLEKAKPRIVEPEDIYD